MSPQAGQGSPTRWWTSLGRSAERPMSSRERSAAKPVETGGSDSGVEAIDGFGVELRRVGEGRDPRRVEHLVGEQPSDAGQMRLVAQEAVDALAGGPQTPGEFVTGDRVGVGTETRQGLDRGGVAGNKPCAGPTLGAGLGEKQCGAVGEDPAGHGAPRLAGLLGVGSQAATLHEMNHERDPSGAGVAVVAPQAQQQVLAAMTDPIQGHARGVGGPGIEGLERGRVHRFEPRQHRAAECLLQSLGVRRYLGQLGHDRARPLR